MSRSNALNDSFFMMHQEHIIEVATLQNHGEDTLPYTNQHSKLHLAAPPSTREGDSPLNPPPDARCFHGQQLLPVLVRCDRPLRCQGEGEDDAGTALGGVLGPDGAAVRFDDGAHDG